MTAWRQAIELAIGEKDLAELGAIARSRRNRRAGWSGRECRARGHGARAFAR